MRLRRCWLVLDLGLELSQVLAGDIGDTKTLLAVCEVGSSSERSGAPRIEVEGSRYCFECGSAWSSD